MDQTSTDSAWVRVDADEDASVGASLHPRRRRFTIGAVVLAATVGVVVLATGSDRQGPTSGIAVTTDASRSQIAETETPREVAATPPPPTAQTPVETPAPATSPPDEAAAPVVDEVGFISSNFEVDDYLVDLGEIPESSASEPSGNFRLICDYSHLAYDDPIVHPGDPGRSHLHMFFGNTEADAASTYESLRDTGDSTCQGRPLNRSAYWAPAVLDADGMVVIPEYITVYYKGRGHGVDGQDVDVAVLPAGLRMIAGQDMSDPEADSPHEWYCEVNQVKQDTIPDCAPGELVGVQLSFPPCWNGVDLDAPDHRSHLAYPTQSELTGDLACPSTHPVAIPEFTLGIWFEHDGNSSNWHLASDRVPGMTTFDNGASFHSDWFGAWDPAVQDQWITACINGLLNCVDGEIGDGDKLVDLPERGLPDRVRPPPGGMDHDSTAHTNGSDQ